MTEQPTASDPAGDDDPGDPDAVDTGDHADVPEDQRADVDPEPGNVDAGDPLTDVADGDVVDPNEE